MGKILLLEFRKNVKSLFLYCGVIAAAAYQVIGLIGEMYTELQGKQALFVIGANVFTTHLLLQAVFAFLVVKDFEAGTVKEYIFVGYSRFEIFIAKYLSLFIESSIALLLSTGGVFVWKTVQNGYGTELTGEEVLFFIKIIVGSILACAFFSFFSMLCVVMVNNALAVGLIFLVPGFLDMFGSLAVSKFEAPEWLSIRYLTNCFYNSMLEGKDGGIALIVTLLVGFTVGYISLWIFQKKEYR